LAALLGDAERFGRYNGDITGTRGTRTGAGAKEAEKAAAAKTDDGTDTDGQGDGHDQEKEEEHSGSAHAEALSGAPTREPAHADSTGVPHRVNSGVPTRVNSDGFGQTHVEHNLANIASSATPLRRPTYIGGLPVMHAERLCGVVLDSPLCSIVRTKLDVDTTLFFDMFVSIDKIHRITVPISITHGADDTVVPCAHAQKLVDRFTMADPFPPQWLEGKGHNDLPKFWLYHTNKVRDPKARAVLEKANEDTKEYLYNYRRFLHHCDIVSVYYSEVEETEPTSLDSDEDEQDHDDKVDEERGLAASAHQARRIRGVAAKETLDADNEDGHVSLGIEGDIYQYGDEEEDDGLLKLPPDADFVPVVPSAGTHADSDGVRSSTQRHPPHFLCQEQQQREDQLGRRPCG